jgi:hypothetical protein
MRKRLRRCGGAHEPTPEGAEADIRAERQSESAEETLVCRHLHCAAITPSRGAEHEMNDAAWLTAEKRPGIFFTPPEGV